MSRLEDEIAALRASYFTERENREVLAIVANEIGNTVAECDNLVMQMLGSVRRDGTLLKIAEQRAMDRRFTGDELTGWGAL